MACRMPPATLAGTARHCSHAILASLRDNRIGRILIEQIPAAEVLEREEDPLQIIPPDHRRDCPRPLPDRLGEVLQHGPAIIVIQRRAVVTDDAVLEETGMITIQEQSLDRTTSLRIQM